jgi:hypothetical protein
MPRVGFEIGFGVKVQALWAFESDALPARGGANRFQRLEKMAGAGKATKSDTNHID